MSDRTKRRARLKKAGLFTTLATLPALALSGLAAGTASAHGAPMDPGSRTYLCYVHGVDHTGQVNPSNPACRSALDQSGATGFYNWFAVLQSNGQGRTTGFIPDGQLCSGASGAYDFRGFDQARTDWPTTHLTSGASYEFTYNVWAHHPGSFHMYITKNGYDPNQPLRWADLEHFHTVTNPPYRGQVGTIDAEYYWRTNLPSGKSGRHVIFMLWERSDSPENFYSCSDVVFDGGNGQVTVPGGSSGAGLDVAEAHTPAVDHDHESHTDHATHAHHATHAAHTTDQPAEGPRATEKVAETVRTLVTGWSGR
ncbi:lytic polysaccharide monooxygenase [Streptomyces sodiiphilus]